MTATQHRPEPSLWGPEPGRGREVGEEGGQSSEAARKAMCRLRTGAGFDSRSNRETPEVMTYPVQCFEKRLPFFKVGSGICFSQVRETEVKLVSLGRAE